MWLHYIDITIEILAGFMLLISTIVIYQKYTLPNLSHAVFSYSNEVQAVSRKKSSFKLFCVIQTMVLPCACILAERHFYSKAVLCLLKIDVMFLLIPSISRYYLEKTKLEANDTLSWKNVYLVYIGILFHKSRYDFHLLVLLFISAFIQLTLLYVQETNGSRSILKL